jgi:hypothetical protein
MRQTSLNAARAWTHRGITPNAEQRQVIEENAKRIEALGYPGGWQCESHPIPVGREGRLAYGTSDGASRVATMPSGVEESADSGGSDGRPSEGVTMHRQTAGVSGIAETAVPSVTLGSPGGGTPDPINLAANSGLSQLSVTAQSTTPSNRLFTTHGTVLYVDPTSGELRHGPPDSSPINASLVSGGSYGQIICEAAERHEPIVCLLDRCQTLESANRRDGPFTPTILEILPLDAGTVALKTAGVFLCAEGDGRVTLSRPVCSDWERFYIGEASISRPKAETAGSAAGLARPTPANPDVVSFGVASSPHAGGTASVRHFIHLFTAHGTVLYVDPASGELRHRTASGEAVNAGLASDGAHGQIVCEIAGFVQPIVCLTDSCRTIASAKSEGGAPTPTTFEIVRLDEEVVALKSAGVFLCPEADGRVTLSRTMCSDWEEFHLGRGAVKRRQAAFKRRQAANRSARLKTAQPNLEAGPSIEQDNFLLSHFENHKNGRGIWKWLQYFDAYERHFARFRGTKVHILEIGVYSGGSLEMWREYFGPEASIYGLDIEPACKCYEGAGVKIFIGDQADRTFWQRFRQQVPALDIVIDDGGHTYEQQATTLEELLPHLRAGGVYMCEDVHGALNPFTEYGLGLARQLNEFHWDSETTDSGARRNVVKGTPFQSMIHSIHFYPFLTVIERNRVPVKELLGSKRGTEWQPFLS